MSQQQNASPQQQQQSPQQQQQNVKPTTWKRMPHPTEPDSKQAIFRVYGICQDFPQYNIREVHDPRPRPRPARLRPDPRVIKKQLPNDLPVPEFTRQFLQAFRFKPPGHQCLMSKSKRQRMADEASLEPTPIQAGSFLSEILCQILLEMKSLGDEQQRMTDEMREERWASLLLELRELRERVDGKRGLLEQLVEFLEQLNRIHTNTMAAAESTQGPSAEGPNDSNMDASDGNSSSAAQMAVNENCAAAGNSASAGNIVQVKQEPTSVFVYIKQEPMAHSPANANLATAPLLDEIKPEVSEMDQEVAAALQAQQQQQAGTSQNNKQEKKQQHYQLRKRRKPQQQQEQQARPNKKWKKRTLNEILKNSAQLPEYRGKD